MGGPSDRQWLGLRRALAAIKIISIDLGTTNSVMVAIKDGQEPACTHYAITPSRILVSREDGSFLPLRYYACHAWRFAITESQLIDQAIT